MNRDHYRGAAAGWARGASLVYAPIAAQLVAHSPVSLVGAAVLDIGAGTGVSEAPLHAARVAQIVGVDLSFDMLAWSRAERPPALVADVMHLPLVAGACDAAVASFVLNHLIEPVGGLVEIARVLRPGGVVLATTYANSSRSENRDTVDEVARAHGWAPPSWYADLKANATPLLGSAATMSAAATGAGLVEVVAEEDDVDVDVTDPRALVDYRFGQAQFAAWLAGLTSRAAASARADAVAAIAGSMQRYRPRVVFLHARAESPRRKM